MKNVPLDIRNGKQYVLKIDTYFKIKYNVQGTFNSNHF